MTVGQRGLTLVEVMVATVIFSMIMLGTVTALSTFASTYKRLQSEVSATTEIREVERFLRDALVDATNERGFFEGSESSLRWVAPIDRVGGAAGMQQLQLTQQGEQLIISFAPMGLSAAPAAWGRVVPDFPLIDDLQQVFFSYQLRPFTDWQTSYVRNESDDGANIPRAVAIRIRSNDKDWPPLIVHFEQYRERL